MESQHRASVSLMAHGLRLSVTFDWLCISRKAPARRGAAQRNGDVLERGIYICVAHNESRAARRCNVARGGRTDNYGRHGSTSRGEKAGSESRGHAGKHRYERKGGRVGGKEKGRKERRKKEREVESEKVGKMYGSEAQGQCPLTWIIWPVFPALRCCCCSCGCCCCCC